MPRKDPHAPGIKDRARGNQRECRARKKALVEDLQRRLLEYEKSGVQATREMQMAARSVAEENAKLRNLLAIRGVSKHEVDAFLCHGGVPPDGRRAAEPDAGAAQRVRNMTMGPVGAPSVSGSLMEPPSVGQPQPCSNTPLAAEVVLETGLAPITRIKPDRSPPRDDLGRMQGSNCASLPPILATVQSFQHSNMPAKTEPYPILRPIEHSASNGMDTECDVAAGIIAQGKGHGDPNLAKVALGCKPSQKCRIKNIRIFELLSD